jgi:cbb3-type cytochrome oxidase subunit 3
MDHPVFYVGRAGKFLKLLIQEHGDYLFFGFTIFCLLVIVWMFMRRRRHPVHEVPVVILPLGNAPRRESEPEQPLFGEQIDDHR